MKDDAFSKIFRALESSNSLDEIDVDPDDHRAVLLRKHFNQFFFLGPGTSVLMLRDSNHSPKLVVPYKICTRYLKKNTHTKALTTHMLHLCANSYPTTGEWEFKNWDIKSYVNSCDAKSKGNYGKRTCWPIGHCKRGRRTFKLFFIDFVTMHNSKGKCYILTILDSFSWHFTAIPSTRDRAIDAARDLYHFFLHHRELPRIISTDRIVALI